MIWIFRTRLFSSPTSWWSSITWNTLSPWSHTSFRRRETRPSPIWALWGDCKEPGSAWSVAVSYTHLRAHETVLDLVCRLLLEKKKKKKKKKRRREKKK